MKEFPRVGAGLAGLGAGMVTGLFGGGGGMVLVPLLGQFTRLEPQQVFPSSISVILPICLVSLLFGAGQGRWDWASALPYLLGSAIGGLLAGKWGRKIPVLWLHRGLGVLILWGGWRYLC